MAEQASKTKTTQKVEVATENGSSDVEPIEAPEIETVDFEVAVRGKTVKLNAPANIEDAPFEVLEAFENDRHLTGFFMLIGDVGKAKLRNAGVTGAEIRDIVIPAWNKASGNE